MTEGREQIEHPHRAIAVSVNRWADVGPGHWWFVHHPDGYLIEVGVKEDKARQLADEINAGRLALAAERKGWR